MKRTAALGVLVMLVGCAGAQTPGAYSGQSFVSGGSEAPVAAAPVGGAAGLHAEAAPASPSPMSPMPAMDAAPSGGGIASAARSGVATSSTPVKSGSPRATSTPIAVRPSGRPVGAGQLTAGVWDDNRNVDFWKPYQAGFVRDHGDDFAMFSDAELASSVTRQAQARGRTELDIQLVLDTTGSMGDELAYLQGELDAIVGQLHTRLPNVQPRWSLVVYRDKGDDYVTRTFDFTVDTKKLRKDLAAQSADGGGDEPEAVVEGLRVALDQSWRHESRVAKMAFWVADAPAHPGEGKALANVIRRAKDDGVHVYPIAASDTSPAAEYQMRSAAQMTGGRYVFLTNDSGIGNDHAEPHIPCYSVTRLDVAMVRMIENEMTGRHVAPESNEVLRSVGKPNAEGTCTLASGALVASF